MENLDNISIQKTNNTPPPPPTEAYLNNVNQLSLQKRVNEKLKLFTTLHFAFSGLSFIGLGLIFLHYKIMNFIFNNKEFIESAEKQADLPFNPETFFEIFKWLYVAFGILTIISITINFLNGLFLSKRKNRMTCIILSSINCIFFPFGTALGIVTIYHLQKDEYINLFDSSD